MSHITGDATLLARLREIAVPVEIRDEDGKLVGHYTPALLPAVEVAYEKAKRSFDPKEMEKRLKDQQGQGIPLEQFWKELEARDKK